MFYARLVEKWFRLQKDTRAAHYLEKRPSFLSSFYLGDIDQPAEPNSTYMTIQSIQNCLSPFALAGF